MSKKCIRCGKPLGEAAADYCIECSNILYNQKRADIDKNGYTETKESINIKNNFNREEKTLLVIGNIILWLGIISSVILTIVFSVQEEYSPYLGGYMEKSFKIEYIPIGIYCIAMSIVSWAILICIAKASKNIREIRNK